MEKMFMEPIVRVGLCTDSPFGLHPCGNYDVNASEEMITYQPLGEDDYMLVKGLEIGRNFHWQRELDMRFGGVIQIRRSGTHTRLLNIIKAEKYLASVVGSEMNPDAPAEFIKAHAVIARSWLIRLLNARCDKMSLLENSADKLISWVSAKPHTDYDVCSDDHCQRYQGLDAVTSSSAIAVVETRGLILTDNAGEVADTRYSKCCGGRTEIFSTCWDDADYHYLQSVDDPYCEPRRLQKALKRHPALLKDYDLATSDYYIWETEVTKDFVTTNLKSKFGVDVGNVNALSVVHRGASGRIKELKIIGDRGVFTIGKELNIRALLSVSHLYSSAFTIEETPSSFILNGRGWGHGVGLCQIGAAVMAAEGASYIDILQQYYPDTHLQKIYD